MLRTAVDTDAFGRRLGGVLRAGDLVILTGSLGAGKTALTKGIGAGMHIQGQVSSPTFVIARVHRALPPHPALVHVDAYRLGGAPELDDLDLDIEMDRSAVVVEWGAGLAEQLSDAYLTVSLTRLPDDTRLVRLTWVGGDWADRVRQLT